MIMKFTQDGKFLMKIGTAGQSHGSNDTENLGLPAKIFVDPKTNEVYVADGYGNKRVIVFDADSGKFKRYWGAYGHKPDDINLGPYSPDQPVAQQFRNPVHCADLSNDGLLYVCDRKSDRVQVFSKDGKFVKEVFVATKTRGDVSGSGRKLWKQKGTGRARIASLRSPLWKGGEMCMGRSLATGLITCPRRCARGRCVRRFPSAFVRARLLWSMGGRWTSQRRKNSSPR